MPKPIKNEMVQTRINGKLKQQYKEALKKNGSSISKHLNDTIKNYVVQNWGR